MRKAKPVNNDYRHVQHGLNIMVLVGFAVILAGIYWPSQPSAVYTPVNKTVSRVLKKTSSIVATTTPSPAAPAPVRAGTPVKHVSVPSGAPSEPVVKPSPSSSVSGLTPVPSGSGSGGSAPGSTSAPSTTASYTSTNWSGYLATTSSYSGVSGTWTAPKATRVGASFSADATWIGIGGVTAGDLIQVGTQNLFSPSGQETTGAFYEMLPDASITIPSLSVTPGDSLSGSIKELSPGQWSISITDTTNSQTFSTTVAYSSSLSSAEWIEEDPSFVSDQQIPFDNFGVASFSGGATVSTGGSASIKGSNAQPIIMVNSQGNPTATPSSVGGDGASFTINYSQ
jgi:hypothetical protein